jgi:hypothetical protein
MVKTALLTLSGSVAALAKLRGDLVGSTFLKILHKGANLETIDGKLLARTKEIDVAFKTVAGRLAAAGDPRLFFTHAHGYITGKIAKHIKLFSKPNALMRLNDSFATVYLRAINGNPHPGWMEAFKICKAMEKAKDAQSFLERAVMAPYAATAFETCGGCMAKIHISTDLKNALKSVKDVDPQDYGNILVFVIEGHLYAEVQVRGRAMGALMMMFSVPVMDWLNTNAKKWRNDAFLEVYNKAVPDPSSAFKAAYNRAEGR